MAITWLSIVKWLVTIKAAIVAVTPPAKKMITFFSLVVLKHSKALARPIIIAKPRLGVSSIADEAPAKMPANNDDTGWRLDSIFYKALY